FRHAVLANLRGPGELVFEHDFPPGSDIVGDTLQGLKADEKVELGYSAALALRRNCSWWQVNIRVYIERK
ncbi:uncharacterized protein BDR25DRAFT_209173, partial [Lindgomyces ingoldianus]